METLQRAINRGNVSTGYDVANSLKVESDNNEYLERSTSGATDGSSTQHTISVWVKRTELGVDSEPVSAGGIGRFRFESNDTFSYQFRSGKEIITNRVFRDTSAWYHIVAAADSSQSTASNRMRLYVNGVEETSFGTAVYQDQDQASPGWGKNTLYSLRVGAAASNTRNFNGYIAEMYYIDGQTLDPTSFGEFDSDTGIWIPKKFSGTHGTLDTYLNFSDSSNLGKNSGGTTDLTANNITAADQAIDTCTNNFCTFNILVHTDNKPTISDGAMKVVGQGTSNWGNAYGSMGVQRGKWYYEYKVDNTDIGGHGWSTFPDTSDDATSAQFLFDQSAVLQGSGTHYYQRINGTQISNESTGFGTSAVNDIFGVFLNADDQEITWAKNGSVLSGSLSQPISLNAAFSGHFIFPCNVQFENDGGQYNFGAYTLISNTRSFSDADGQGKFVYSPVLSGVNYFALCSKNLAEYG